METNILWTGREYYSLENCVLLKTDAGFEANSVIIGMYNHQVYRVEYFVKTNFDWETVSVDIKCRIDNRVMSFCFECDGKGNWIKDGKTVIEFDGCRDIDISLSPFTNTLPINRLNLAENEQQQIRVIYFDLLEQQVRPVHQKYTRLSKSQYKFENVPNDFEAVIAVDDMGLVIDYPGLFERTF